MFRSPSLMSYHDHSPSSCDECQERSRTDLPANDSSRRLENDVGDEEDKHNDILEKRFVSIEVWLISSKTNISKPDSERQLLRHPRDGGLPQICTVHQADTIHDSGR
jgi:hypothetical protein